MVFNGARGDPGRGRFVPGIRAREGRDAVLKKRGSKRNLGDGKIFAPRAPAPRFPHWTT
jgi:hypothetical protein